MRSHTTINPLYPDRRPATVTHENEPAVALVFGFLLGAAAMAFGVGLGAWLFA